MRKKENVDDDNEYDIVSTMTTISHRSYNGIGAGHAGIVLPAILIWASDQVEKHIYHVISMFLNKNKHK